MHEIVRTFGNRFTPFVGMTVLYFCIYVTNFYETEGEIVGVTGSSDCFWFSWHSLTLYYQTHNIFQLHSWGFTKSYGVCIVFPSVFKYFMCLSRFIIKVLYYVFISLVNLQVIWICFCKFCSKLFWLSMNWRLFISIPWGGIKPCFMFL